MQNNQNNTNPQPLPNIYQEMLDSLQNSNHNMDTDQRSETMNENHYVLIDSDEEFYNEMITNIHNKPGNKHKITEKILRDCFGTVNNDYKSALKKIFSELNNEAEMDEDQKIERKINLRHSKVCGKILTSHDVGVYCQECSVIKNSIICLDCFEKGDHRGHNFTIKQKVSGMCDCGDPSAWKKEGYCSDHIGIEEACEDLDNEEHNKVPYDFKRRLKNALLKGMHFLIYYLERPENTSSFNKAVSDCIIDVFISLTYFCKNYPILAELIAEILISPSNYALNHENWGNFKLWHFCDNLEQFPKLIKKEDIISPKLSKKEISFDVKDLEGFETKKISKEMSLEILPNLSPSNDINNSLGEINEKPDNFKIHKVSFFEGEDKEFDEENLEYMIDSTSNLEDDEDFMNQLSKKNFCNNLNDVKKGYDICSCNLLSLLFRNSLKLTAKSKTLAHILISTFFSNYDFKKEFGLCYIKYFFFLIDLENQDQVVSGFLEVVYQVLNSEDISYHVASSEHFKSFLRKLRDHFQNLLSQRPHNLWKVFYEGFKILKYINMKSKSSVHICQNRQLVMEFFNCFSVVHFDRYSFNYIKKENESFEVLSLDITNSMNIQVSLYKLVIEMCKGLNKSNHKDRQFGLWNMIVEVKETIVGLNNQNGEGSSIKSVEKNNSDGNKVYFTLLYERIFSYLLVNYLCLENDKSTGKLFVKEPTFEAINNLNKILFPKDFKTFCGLFKENFDISIISENGHYERGCKEAFWLHICNTMIRSVGTIKEISRKFWNFLSNVPSDYKNIYSGNYFYDLDMVLLQMSLLSIKKESAWNIVVNNFSKLEAYKLLLDTSLDQKTKMENIYKIFNGDEKDFENLVMLFGDHIELICQIQNNELAIPYIINICENFDEDIDNIKIKKTFYKKSYESFQKNYLLAFGPISYKDFIKDVSHYIPQEHNQEYSIEKIADIDLSTSIQRLKDSVKQKMKGKFEPSLLWKNQNIYSRSFENIDSSFKIADNINHINEGQFKITSSLKNKFWSRKQFKKLLEIAFQDIVCQFSHYFRSNLYGLIQTFGCVDAFKGHISESVYAIKDLIDDRMSEEQQTQASDQDVSDKTFEWVKNISTKEVFEPLWRDLDVLLDGWACRRKLSCGSFDTIENEFSNSERNVLTSNILQFDEIESPKNMIRKDSIDNPILEAKIISPNTQRKSSLKLLADKKKQSKMSQMAKKKERFLKNQEQKCGDLLKKLDEAKTLVDCIYCHENIDKNENYFLFGQLHFANFREYSKLTSLTDIVFEANIAHDSSSFNKLIVLKENTKKIVESSINPYISTCDHAIHIKCLEDQQNAQKLKIYNNLEIACTICKTAVDLPIPNYFKDEEVPKQEEADITMLQQNEENSSESLFGKLIQKCRNGYFEDIYNFKDKEEDLLSREYIELVNLTDYDENLAILFGFEKKFELIYEKLISKAKVMAINEKVLTKYESFFQIGLCTISNMIQYSDIIDVNIILKDYAKIYSSLLSCVRKSKIINIFVKDEVESKDFQANNQLKYACLLLKKLDQIKISDFFGLNTGQIQIQDLIRKNNIKKFVKADIDEFYVALIEIIQALSISMAEAKIIIKKFTSYMLSLKCLQYKLRFEKQFENYKALFEIDDLLENDEFFLDSVLALIKKMVTCEIIINYDVKKNDENWIKQIHDLSQKTNFMSKYDELKIFLEFLEIEINIKKSLDELKKDIFETSQLNDPPQNIECEKQEELVQVENQDMKMDEENIIQETSDLNIIDEQTMVAKTDPDNQDEKENNNIVINLGDYRGMTDDQKRDCQINDGKKLLDLFKKIIPVNHEQEQSFKLIKKKLNDFLTLSGQSPDISETEKLGYKEINYLERKLDERASHVDYYLTLYKRNPYFSFANLERVFFDLYHDKLYRKCDKCSDFPKKTEFAVCLICNYQICLVRCFNDDKLSVENGNLTNHAFNCHAGTCAFVNAMVGNIIQTHNGTFITVDRLYVDKFGMSYAENGKLKNLIDINKKSLTQNHNYLMSMQKKLLEHKIKTAIIQQSLKQNVHYKVYSL